MMQCSYSIIDNNNAVDNYDEKHSQGFIRVKQVLVTSLSFFVPDMNLQHYVRICSLFPKLLEHSCFLMANHYTLYALLA